MPVTSTTTYGPAYCPKCSMNVPHRIETTLDADGRVVLRMCHCLNCKDAHTS